MCSFFFLPACIFVLGCHVAFHVPPLLTARRPPFLRSFVFFFCFAIDCWCAPPPSVLLRRRRRRRRRSHRRRRRCSRVVAQSASTRLHAQVDDVAGQRPRPKPPAPPRGRRLRFHGNHAHALGPAPLSLPFVCWFGLVWFVCLIFGFTAAVGCLRPRYRARKSPLCLLHFFPPFLSLRFRFS